MPIAVMVFVVGAAAAVTGWTDTFRVGSPIKVSGPSPFNTCTADQVPGNIQINIANSEVEPWLVVNPTDPANLVALWSQDWWSSPDQGARGFVAGVSLDSGDDWQDVVVPGLTLCTGGSAVRTADPWLSFAPNGDLYLSALGFGVTSDGHLGPPSTIQISKSKDGGLSWGPRITLIEDTDFGVFNDKESITADPFDSNLVYAVWDRLFKGADGFPRAQAMLSRTTNGGQSWEPARVIENPGIDDLDLGNQIVVLPDGTLIDFFTEAILSSQGGVTHYELSVSLIRSVDKGQSWLPKSKPIRAAEMLAVCPGAPLHGFCVFDPDTGQRVRDASVLFDVAVDPNNGNLYVEWSDGRFSSFQNQSKAFSMSTDGGFTWSAPIKINRTPTNIAPANQQAFGHSLHVAPGGTIGAAYYDFRFNDPNPGALTDYWLVHCHPTTLTACADPANWKDENRLTSASFDIEKAPFSIGLFVGDYQGMVSADGQFLTVFSQPHGTDPDSVFFQRVRVSR